MNKNKKYQRKFKRYWKLILKSKEELDISKWKKFRCFDSLMTESDVVSFFINADKKLKETYEVYQDILYCFRKKDWILVKF